MANFWTFGLNYWETDEDRWVHAAMVYPAVNYVIFSYVIALSQVFMQVLSGDGV